MEEVECDGMEWVVWVIFVADFIYWGCFTESFVELVGQVEDESGVESHIGIGMDDAWWDCD